MNNFLYAIVFALISAMSYGQVPKLFYTMKKSEVFKDEYKTSILRLAESDGNGGVVIVREYQGGLFSSASGYYFEHYDSEMKLVREFEYDRKASDDVKSSAVLGIIMNKGVVNIIDIGYSKNDKAYVFSANSASISDFVFTKSELYRLPAAEVNRALFFNFSGPADGDSGASMIVNEDRNAFAITIDLMDKKAETHKILLYDSNLNNKIDHTFKRNVKDKNFIYENIDVSRDGNTMYVLGKVYNKEQKKKKEGANYQYELTRITKDSEISQVFDTQEHFAASLKAIIVDDRITCVGFYSDKKDNRFKGISYFELDPITLEIRKAKFNEFTKQFMMDKYGTEEVSELRNLTFRKLFVTMSGEIVFNAEEFFQVTYRNFGGSGGQSVDRTFDHYGDIVSAKLSPDGDIIWARNINKRQEQVQYGDDSYVSYTSTIKDDDTYFFINAGEKVKHISKNRIQFGLSNYKRSNLNLVRINKTGDIIYKEILDDAVSDVPFMSSKGAVSLATNSVFFLGQRGKKKQILKVTIDDDPKPKKPVTSVKKPGAPANNPTAPAKKPAMPAKKP